MSYHITVGYQPNSSKFPFSLNTEADQIPLTRSELESLKFEIECAMMDSDVNYQKEIAHECA